MSFAGEEEKFKALFKLHRSKWKRFSLRAFAIFFSFFLYLQVYLWTFNKAKRTIITKIIKCETFKENQVNFADFANGIRTLSIASFCYEFKWFEKEEILWLEPIILVFLLFCVIK